MFEFENLVRKPDFEVRCDAFIDDVNKTFSRRRSIHVQAINVTMDRINSFEWTRGVIDKMVIKKDALKRYLQEKNYEAERDSATFNRAEVHFWTNKSTDYIFLSQFLTVSEDVFALAHKYNGVAAFSEVDFEEKIDRLTIEMESSIREASEHEVSLGFIFK